MLNIVPKNLGRTQKLEKYAHTIQNYTLDLKFVSVKVFKYKCKKEQYESSSL